MHKAAFAFDATSSCRDRSESRGVDDLVSLLGGRRVWSHVRSQPGVVVAHNCDASSAACAGAQHIVCLQENDAPRLATARPRLGL